MCYNCGCHIPDDNMGSDDNITESTLKHLAGDWGKSDLETKKQLFEMLDRDLKEGTNEVDKDHHLKEMFEKASNSWGQSIKEAKKNTHDLLKSQIS
jgi:hypothetical protein